MSNNVVGSIYQLIIEEVINASRGDFEDSGVDESVADDLRRTWQAKLTSMKIADFPWEPKLDAPSKATTSSQQSQQAKKQQQQQQQQLPQQQPPAKKASPPSSVRAGAAPQSQGLIQPIGHATEFALPQTPTPNGTHIKQEPVDGLLKSEAGSGVNQAPSVPPRVIEQLKTRYGDEAQATINLVHNINSGAARNNLGPPRQDVAYSQALQQQMRAQAGTRPNRPPGLDGVDDEDDDEDAINSDLDDSDEAKGSGEEDEEGANVMLCVYDKVQRVKSKWKCVLKDGVLTANGREYVFTKAQGELEW